MQIAYSGLRHPEGTCVSYRRIGQTAQMLPTYRHVANLSLGGYDWGNDSPGAAQLALALLCHALHDSVLARELCQEYKRRVVARLSKAEFFLSDVEIVREADLIAADREEQRRRYNPPARKEAAAATRRKRLR